MVSKKVKAHPVMNEWGLMRYGRCMICTAEIFAHSLWEIHMIYEDVNEVGRPICLECFQELRHLIPQKLDVIERKQAAKIEIKRGLDKWL